MSEFWTGDTTRESLKTIYHLHTMGDRDSGQGHKPTDVVVTIGGDTGDSAKEQSVPLLCVTDMSKVAFVTPQPSHPPANDGAKVERRASVGCIGELPAPLPGSELASGTPGSRSVDHGLDGLKRLATPCYVCYLVVQLLECGFYFYPLVFD